MDRHGERCKKRKWQTFSSTGQARAIFNQRNTEAVSKATAETLGRHGVERTWAFPSTQTLSQPLPHRNKSSAHSLAVQLGLFQQLTESLLFLLHLAVLLTTLLLCTLLHILVKYLFTLLGSQEQVARVEHDLVKLLLPRGEGRHLKMEQPVCQSGHVLVIWGRPSANHTMEVEALDDTIKL